MLELLFEKYPKAFIKGNKNKPLPLKIGISNDILDENPEISATDLDHAMRYYTNALRYHKAMLQGTHRVDLNGETIEPISVLEKANARKCIAGIRKNFEKQRPYYAILVYKTKVENGKERKYMVYRVCKRDNTKVGNFGNKKQVEKAFGVDNVQFIKNELTKIRHETYMRANNKKGK